MNKHILSFALTLVMLVALVPFTTIPALAAVAPTKPSFEVKYRFEVSGEGTLLFSNEPVRTQPGGFIHEATYIFSLGTKIAWEYEGVLGEISLLGESSILAGSFVWYGDAGYELTLTESMLTDSLRICGYRGLLTIAIDGGSTGKYGTINENVQKYADSGGSDIGVLLSDQYFDLNTSLPVNLWRQLAGDSFQYLPKSSDYLRFALEPGFHNKRTGRSYTPDNDPLIKEMADMVAKLTAGKAGTYEKAEAIFNWVVSQFTYDNIGWDAEQGKYYRADGIRFKIIFGIDYLRDAWKNKRAACDNYSMIFKTMCRSVGIPTITVSSFSYEHGWNAFYDEADDRWVIADTTYNKWDRSASDNYATYIWTFYPMARFFCEGYAVGGIEDDMTYFDGARLELYTNNTYKASFQKLFPSQIELVDLRCLTPEYTQLLYDPFVGPGYFTNRRTTVECSDAKPKYAYEYDVETETMELFDFCTPDSDGMIYFWDFDYTKLLILSETPVINLDTAADWAKSDIQSAITKGFIPADLQSDYKNVITRAEFCRMAVKFVEYKTGKTIDAVLSDKGVARNPNAFSDTKDEYILAAFALGITNGTKAPTATTPGTFTPNGEFSREQAATMIMNTCKVIGMDTGNIPTSDFIDLNTASTWAVDGINFVRANGIMSGTSTDPSKPTFNSKGTYTRQESIVTFDRIK